MTTVVTGVPIPAVPITDAFAASHYPVSAAEAATALHASTNGSMPRGLCTKLSEAVDSFPLRIMIVDNSGSMQEGDGQRLVPNGAGTMRTLRSSRWHELGDDVVQVAQMSEALQCRTDVHLLNPRPGFSAMTVGPPKSWDLVAPLGRSVDAETVKTAMTRTSPGGTTPLTEACMQIVSMIEPAAAALRARGEQVCVIIATDGMPNNRATFVAAMQHLQRLPVWVVVRLCTNDDDIVGYWNDLDAQLEAPLEVLDDVKSEADEIHAVNRWLTYGPPLHSARLFGLPGKVFDDLDEKALLPWQLKEFLEDLLGADVLGAGGLPEPELDPRAFAEAVGSALGGLPPVYDPRQSKMRPWVDTRALERHVARAKRGGDAVCSIM